MALKKGDIIDERKRFPDSCGLVLKVLSGGEGFEKILCCGHELTLEDVVPSFNQERGRRAGGLVVGMAAARFLKASSRSRYHSRTGIVSQDEHASLSLVRWLSHRGSGW